MAENSEPKEDYKTRAKQIIDKIHKKHDAFSDWVQTLEIRHSDAYTSAVKDTLMDENGKINFSKLDYDATKRDELADKITQNYMEWGKKTFKWDLGDDDLLKSQALYHVSGKTKEMLVKDIYDHKSNYTLGRHKESTKEHIQRLQSSMIPNISDHIKEEHIDDLVKYMNIDAKPDLIKKDIHNFKQQVLQYALQEKGKEEEAKKYK